MINEIIARDAAAQSLVATRPANADAYKVATTPNFKPPEGLEFKLDDKDPLWPQARAWAHKHGLSQEAFAEAIDLVAGRDLGSAQSVKAAYDAEVAKLGTAATQRVTAVTNWLNAVGGPQAAALTRVLALAPVADTIVAVENLMKTFSSQGVQPFNRAHDATPPAGNKIPGYDKMSFEQRRFAQDQQRAARAAR